MEGDWKPWWNKARFTYKGVGSGEPTTAIQKLHPTAHASRRGHQKLGEGHSGCSLPLNYGLRLSSLCDGCLCTSLPTLKDFSHKPFLLLASFNFPKVLWQSASGNGIRIVMSVVTDWHIGGGTLIQSLCCGIEAEE